MDPAVTRKAMQAAATPNPAITVMKAVDVSSFKSTSSRTISSQCFSQTEVKIKDIMANRETVCPSPSSFFLVFNLPFQLAGAS